MTDWAWHVHHDVLVEPLTESIETRCAYIRIHKPKGEIKTRLRLLKRVRGEIPAKLVAARAAFLAAVAAESAAAGAAAWSAARWAAWLAAAESTAESAAWSAFAKAHEDAIPEINRMHLEECPDCPWDGKTIFPEANL